MGDDQDPELKTTLLRYALAVGFLALYAAVIVGGFVAVVTGVGWATTNVVEPAVGGGDALSAVLLAAAVGGYVLVVYKLTTSGATLGSESGSALSSLKDSDWGKN